MNEDEKSRLEFKRKFILDNLERIKKGHDRVMNNSESAKKWVVTIWFGFIALSLKETWRLEDTFKLSLLIVIMFYLLDSYFVSLAIEYSKRIDPIERWIMSSSDEEILNLNSALHDIGPSFSFGDRILNYLNALRNRYVLIFYVFLVFASILVTKLLTFNNC